MEKNEWNGSKQLIYDNDATSPVLMLFQLLKSSDESIETEKMKLKKYFNVFLLLCQKRKNLAEFVKIGINEKQVVHFNTLRRRYQLYTSPNFLFDLIAILNEV